MAEIKILASWALLIDQEEPIAKFIQVVDRIQLLVVVGLWFPCWLSAGVHS